MLTLLGSTDVTPERGVFSLAELPSDRVDMLVRRACDLHLDRTAHTEPLADHLVGVLFTKTSTRTRTAFTAATLRLGGRPISFGPGELQLETGESLEDTARVLGCMLDMLVVRTAGPVAQMRTLSRCGRIPVVNAMAQEEHPTQAICDLATVRAHFGQVAGVRLLYVGEGNNSAVGLVNGLAHYPGCELTLATPTGYGVARHVLDAAVARGASVRQTHSLDDLPTEVDVVYTTRWQTTGTTKGDAAWRDVFRPFHVDEAFMARWPGAVFMHDLPAHRGDEVAGPVLDGPASLAWTQVEMKLTSAMAVLESLAR